MERAPWRGRNRVVSGAAGTHREPLFLGSEPWGQGHTRPEQDLAQLLCCAQGQHPAIQGLCSVLTLTGRTGKEKELKKKSWEMAPTSPSLTAVQSATHSAQVSPRAPRPPWAGSEGKVTLGAQSVLGRRSCPFPSPTHPHSHVQGAVTPPGRGSQLWGPG